MTLDARIADEKAKHGIPPLPDIVTVWNGRCAVRMEWPLPVAAFDPASFASVMELDA